MIPTELLQKIRRIEIRTNRLVNDVLAGEYHSVFKGRGIEFSEVREYQIGDDVRNIDWNVTARMGHPFVKRFSEERELTVMFLVDASASQDFGSKSSTKGEIAAELTALLAFSAIKNNDRVGLVIFTDEIEEFVPPKKGRKHVLRLIHRILDFEPTGHRTDLLTALEYLGHIQRRKCVAFLISDFLGPSCDQELEIVNERHDLIAIPISDEREVFLPKVRGFIDFEDAETGRVITRNLASPAFREFYSTGNRQRIEDMKSRFQRMGIGCIPIRTGEDYVPPLVRFFEARAKRY